MTGDSLEELRALALTDALTQIPNRRAFDERLSAAWATARRARQPIALIMVDVDRFKAYNDAYGHVAGDHCLKSVAHALQRALRRTTDLVARYGGEEFALLLPDTDASGAVALAEALRAAIVDLALPHAGSSLGVASASFGVASRIPDDGDPERLIRAADAALYQAKSAGRNCVVSDQPETVGRLAQSPPARTPHNLPVVSHRLVGRAAEFDDVRTSVRERAAVAIVGPAGVGKTRLALEVAYDLGAETRDGVCFLDLAALPADADLAAIATALAGIQSLSARPGEDPMTAVLAHVRDRDQLLLIDNAEHVIHATAAFLDALRAATSGVRVIVTSRLPLPSAAIDETVRLAPLAVPPRDDDRQARTYSAVELFLARAVDALPQRRPSDDLAAAAAQIVRRLDGLPLAIELAAARLAVLTPAELLVHLDDRLRLLRGNRGSERHRALDVLLDWSAALLSERAARLLWRLSIFPGAWTLAGAQAVCLDDGDPFDTMDLIGELLDASLVFVERDDTTRRFRLLETTRDYAAHRLEAGGERGAIAERHARYALQVAREFRERVASTPAAAWLDAQMSYADDYRVAVGWAEADPENFELFARLNAALVFYSTRRFFDLPSAIERLERVLAVIDDRNDIDDRLHADLRHAYGHALSLMSTPDRVAGIAEEALARYRALDDDVGIARALALVAHGTVFSDPARAEASLLEAREIAHRCGERRVEAMVGRGLGRLASDRGDHQAAEEALRATIVVYEELGDPVGVALTLGSMAFSAHARGDSVTAVEYGRDALAALGEQRADYERGWILYNLATFELDAGSAVDSLQHAREAVRLLASGGNDHMMRSAMETVSHHRLAAGEVDQAVRLLAFATRGSFENHGMTQADRAWFDRHVAALRAATNRFDQLAAEGAALSRERAIALVLEA